MADDLQKSSGSNRGRTPDSGPPAGSIDQEAQTGSFVPPEPVDTSDVLPKLPQIPEYAKQTLNAHDLKEQDVPKRIGQYRIKRIIASGGMGTVYLAQQESPRRVVALKVMKKGIASRSALRRFEYESQTLGRLSHPNIAQIYEAGTHDDGEGGVPFFAMEYIANAKTVTDDVKARKLGTRERLLLFSKVCDAVHHGHQKGIIHRDLKPGNILVDSNGEPKIIDFGVARATDSDMAITTLQTDIGQLIGTLQYMSPEQCEADPHDLDTRSDVYSLGVILYELLTEQLPYDLTHIAIHEAARIIREETPAQPSTIKLSLRGDVETITLKALEKNRLRRYQSAAELAGDIHRYLNDDPIEARPASMAYRLRMMARKHRAAFVAISAIAVALVVAVASTTWGLIATTRAKADVMQQRDLAVKARDAEEEQRHRVERLFEQGHQLAQLFMNDFYDAVDELPDTLGVRQMLVDAAIRYLEGIEPNLGDSIELRIDLANAHRRIGLMMGGIRGPNLNLTDDALEHFRTSERIHTDIQKDAPDYYPNLQGLAVTVIYIGDALSRQRPYDDALGMYDRALAIIRQVLQSDPEDAAFRRLLSSALLKSGDMNYRLKDFDAASEAYTQTLLIRRELLDENPDSDLTVRDLTVGLGRIGMMAKHKGDLGAALNYYREVLLIREDRARQSPNSIRWRRDVMITHRLIAPVLRDHVDNNASLTHYQLAFQISAELAVLDPADKRARKDLDATRSKYILALNRSGRVHESRDFIEQAIADYERLVESFPNDAGLSDTLEQLRQDLLSMSVEESIDP